MDKPLDNVIDLSDYREPVEEPLGWALILKLPDAGEISLTEQDIQALFWARSKLDGQLTRLRRQQHGSWETADYEEEPPQLPVVGGEYVALGPLLNHGARVIMRCERTYASPSGRNKGLCIVVLSPVSISRFASRWYFNPPAKPKDERLTLGDFSTAYRLLAEPGP